MIYTSAYSPDLKANIMRDRNFKTPYYTNPYGYSKNAFDRSKVSQSQFRKVSTNLKTNAFNPDTRSILSPLIDDSPIRAKKSPPSLAINQNISPQKNSHHNTVWVDKGKASFLRMKTTLRQSKGPGFALKSGHNKSIDLGSTKSSNFNQTFTSGFASTMNSTGFKSDATASSIKDTFYSTRGENKNYVRRYGKYRINQNISTYDFSGGDTPWTNKSGVNNKIAGQEQNFKINYMNYGNEFNSARPVAHTKAKKYCSMTRFAKNLVDSKIFQRGKMVTYRGTHN
jgi:hypothetical protein